MSRDNFKKDVIIFGNETQSLGILRALQGENLNILLIDQDSRGVALYSRYRKLFFKSPKYDDHQKLLNFFVDLADKREYKKCPIFFTDDDQIKFFSIYKDVLSRHYCFTLPGWDILQKYFLKSNLYDNATKMFVPCPGYCTISEYNNDTKIMEYPFIIKPSDKCQFLRKIRKKVLFCKNEDEYNRHLKLMRDSGIDEESLLIQEFIPGEGKMQYSVAGMSVDGRISHSVTANRLRQHPKDFGKATTQARLIEDVREISDYAEKIVKGLEYTGPFEIEFKYDESRHKYMLLDFNLRYWGWHSLLTTEVNIPKLLLFKMTDYLRDYEHVRRNDAKAMKSWNNFITDFPVAMQLMLQGKLLWSEYIHEIKTSKQAVFDIRDPVPFLAHILLIPYLFFKRGY